MNRKQRRAEARTKSKRPASLDAILTDAAARQREGDLAGAVALYRQALAVDPTSVDALMNLGTSLVALGHEDEAVASFRRAQELLPRVAPVHRDVGAGLAKLGRWDEAIAAFQRAAALARDADTLAGLGDTLVEVGRSADARAVLERAAAAFPLSSPVYFQLARAVYDDRNLAPAVDALTKAVLADPAFVFGRFALAVALDLSGSTAAAEQHFAMLHRDEAVYRGAVESFRYASRRRSPATRFFAAGRETLRFALDEARLEGAVLDLGVRHGVSTRWIAEHAGGVVHAFDSFEGLPEAWHILPAGAYSTHGKIPELPANVHVHVGLFDRTLPAWIAETEGPIRFLNVDCDLYSSTKCALDLLAPRIVPGTVVAFDEYLINDAWAEDEHKAFQEAVAARGWTYEYLAFNLFTGQAVVRMGPG